MKKLLAFVALAGLLAACAAKSSTRGVPTPGSAQMLSDDVHAKTAPQLPSPPAPTAPAKVFTILMYQFTMPFGTVTRSDPFWKLLQEDAVDVGTYDLLYKNGMRVGRGQIDTWPRLRAMVDQGSTSYQTSTFSGLSDQDVQLDMAPKVDEQTMFVFDENGATGRSYGESRNRFSFRFQWAPHKADTVRMRICPIVVTARSRFDYSASDEPAEADYTSTEHLYDLRLCADIGPGEFLVVAPSPDAGDSTRVGHCFLTMDGPSDRYEKMLVLVASPLALDKAHSRATQPTH